MYKIRNALARFMYGRNGVDQLNVALLWGYILLWIPQFILALTLRSGLLDLLFDLAGLALLVVMFFRIFSNSSRYSFSNSRRDLMTATVPLRTNCCTP